MSDAYLELEQEVKLGEVGELVEIVTPQGTIRAIWLGVLGENGWDLTQAMQLMADMERECRGKTES